jgi:hypothetical protein
MMTGNSSVLEQIEFGNPATFVSLVEWTVMNAENDWLESRV